MGWVRLDDRITEHPKIASAGPLGLAFYVAGIVYCNRNLTDGFIPRAVAATLLAEEWVDLDGVVWSAAAHSGHQGWEFDCLEIAEHLVDVGLLECHAVTNGGSHGDGYVIHDYLEYQPARKDVLERREKDLERQRKWRENRTRTKKRPSKRDNAVTNAVVTRDPTPTPTYKEEAKASSLERERNPVWDALVEVFGEPSTDTARTLRGKVCSSLTRAGATHDDVLTRARSWPSHFSDATLTETALEKHWDALGRKPLRVTS